VIAIQRYQAWSNLAPVSPADHVPLLQAVPHLREVEVQCRTSGEERAPHTDTRPANNSTRKLK